MPAPAGADAYDPDPDCPLCPRLVAFRRHYQEQEPDWFNAPVPTFTGSDVRVLIVGLAPGLRGANRTGRPFTGDFAGDLLYETLLDFGLAQGRYEAHPNDGLSLEKVAITNAVRCVPPENKPVGAEIKACRPFLSTTLSRFDDLRAIVALGRIAHESVLTAYSLKKAAYPFGHGAEHSLFNEQILFDSYHCSRYNTNTRRLTPTMFRSVFSRVVHHAKTGRQAPV
ncbi:MAG: uracil-DNA glycosylase [Pseudomonadota bacterium]